MNIRKLITKIALFIVLLLTAGSMLALFASPEPGCNGSSSKQHPVLTPNGTYVNSKQYTLTPSGSYVSGKGYNLAPNGQYVSKGDKK